MPAAIATLNLVVRPPGMDNLEKPYAAIAIVVQQPFNWSNFRRHRTAPVNFSIVIPRLLSVRTSVAPLAQARASGVAGSSAELSKSNAISDVITSFKDCGVLATWFMAAAPPPLPPTPDQRGARLDNY
jgi:hypothetical protein